MTISCCPPHNMVTSTGGNVCNMIIRVALSDRCYLLSLSPPPSPHCGCDKSQQRGSEWRQERAAAVANRLAGRQQQQQQRRVRQRVQERRAARAAQVLLK